MIYPIIQFFNTFLLVGLLGTRPIMSEGGILNKLGEFWAGRHQTPFPLNDGLNFMEEKQIDAILSATDGFRIYLEVEMR